MKEIKKKPIGDDISPFSMNALNLDVEKEDKEIEEGLVQVVYHQLHRQGAVVGISGGVDSSVVLALCARVFGSEHVVGILLPEKESSPENVDLAQRVADQYQVKTVTENISAALEGFGCYRRRDEAIRLVIPEYQPGWDVKMVLPGNLLEAPTLNVFRLVVTDPFGREFSKRLPLREYLKVMASTNFKQRTRMSFLYYHAELRNYAVVGTMNKDEHDLGFFVKYGDGGMDVNPIGHLFKSQVFQLAKYLGVPEEIQRRTPTTDTYPGGGSQIEFFYRVPFEILDTIWFGYTKNVPIAEIASALGISSEQVQRVVDDIKQKVRTTIYLRTPIVSLKGEQKELES